MTNTSRSVKPSIWRTIPFFASDEDPISGVPLFDPFKGLWSYRAGHLRILYRIMPEARFVVVLFIGRAAA
jgi:mRNA-degrading endonuclease RelE of RelBE toxin-antitoxin system